MEALLSSGDLQKRQAGLKEAPFSGALGFSGGFRGPFVGGLGFRVHGLIGGCESWLRSEAARAACSNSGRSGKPVAKRVHGFRVSVFRVSSFFFGFWLQGSLRGR